MINQEGVGWRLAWDKSRLKYPFLIGGEYWAFELTDNEWKAMAEVILALADEVEQISSQLMDEEKIFLEIERGLCWGRLEGDKRTWELQVLLNSEIKDFRGIEAFWPSSIAKDLVYGMRSMRDSYQ